MKENLNRTLIETTIRNSIKQIKIDPERSMRNLIDMALSFSKGRFQKHFLEAAQTMLKKETSCYYKIIPDLVTNVDTERIVTVSMNIGYNSCTLGTQTIREIERKEHFNIPWSILLELNQNCYYENITHYHSLFSQGRELGIYTWNIYTIDNPSYILELAETFSECAFLIFCTPNNITPALLEDAKNIYNIIFLVEYSDTIQEVCSLLRSQQFLYSVFYNNKKSDFDTKLLNDILSDTENLNAIFTVLFSKNSTIKETALLYPYIRQLRSEQKYRTIPFDFLQDNYFIDNIISDQICSIGFSQNGICHSLIDHTIYKDCNLFHNSLFHILKTISSYK